MLCEKQPDIIAIIAFGSFGTSYERSDSDLDLAILTEKIASINEGVLLWNLAQEIASQVKRDVDLVNLRLVSTVFCFQILTTGVVIYCSNELALAHFDNLAMVTYQRLNEERKEILEDYEKGIFYGG